MIDVEDLIDAAVTSLQDGLDARFDVIDTEKGDFEIVRPQPEMIVPGGLDVLQSYPNIEVAAPDGFLEGFSMGQHSADHTLSLFVLFRNEMYAEWNVLYRTTLRYQRAICEVMADPDAFGEHASITRLRWANRVNPETEERPQTIMSGLLHFELGDVAVRP